MWLQMYLLNPCHQKEVDPMRKILIVIDMQNDFIDAALGTKEAQAIVDAVKEKILSYPADNIIATMDTHFENYMETQEGKYLPVPHCIKGSDGWKIRPEIAELLAGAKIYEKPTFGSTALAADLKALSEKEEIELELIGLCTDICVVSNALLLKACIFQTQLKILRPLSPDKNAADIFAAAELFIIHIPDPGNIVSVGIQIIEAEDNGAWFL